MQEVSLSVCFVMLMLCRERIYSFRLMLRFSFRLLKFCGVVSLRRLSLGQCRCSVPWPKTVSCRRISRSAMIWFCEMKKTGLCHRSRGRLWLWISTAAKSYHLYQRQCLIRTYLPEPCLPVIGDG